ncbi:MAG: hypothetical protein ACM3QS_04560 [Bacteroidota bacterium]
MQNSRRVPLAAIVLSIAALACAVPAISVQDPSAISTAAAQTVIAGLTQAAPPATLPPGLTPTFPPLETATLPPTLTETATLPPTLTLTSTPVTPTLTATLAPTLTLPYTTTPLMVQVTVTVPTNCRTGPGIAYTRVGALLVGEVAQVIARNSAGTYWYIRNPDRPPEYCWLWGQYAIVTGNIGTLPIYTPPPSPTPTAAFDASYAGLDNCVGWWTEVRLKNAGGIVFRSIEMTLKDTDNGLVISNTTDGFVDRSGCQTVTHTALNVDGSFIVSAPALRYDPSGHRIRLSITLCSKLGLNGTCVTKSIAFTP